MRRQRKPKSPLLVVKKLLVETDENYEEIISALEKYEVLSPEFERNLTTYYQEEIVKILNLKEFYDVEYILSKVKSAWEYSHIISALNDFIEISEAVPHLDNSTKQRHEEKRKFNRKKQTILKNLNEIGIHSGIVVDEILNKEFEPNPLDYVGDKEYLLNIVKNNLYLDLTEFCGTGKKRALEIIRILNYLPTKCID